MSADDALPDGVREFEPGAFGVAFVVAVEDGVATEFGRDAGLASVALLLGMATGAGPSSAVTGDVTGFTAVAGWGCPRRPAILLMAFRYCQATALRNSGCEIHAAYPATPSSRTITAAISAPLPRLRV